MPGPDRMNVSFREAPTSIDSKLRACDLVSLRVRDVCHDDHVAARTVVMQHKTQRPVQFTCSRAACIDCRIWDRASTQESSTPGLKRSALTQQRMARTRCAALNQR